ncbi:MAG: tetratricopeptide repeat protein [Magnetococcales bacterium]|nr:tetratricopeptide repeat protein [Magnetococcales bacterium]
MNLPKIIIFPIVLLLSFAPLFSWGSDSYYQQESLILDDLRSAVDRFGPRNYKTAEYRLKLADFYITSGEYHKAEPLLHQVRRMMEKRLGPENKRLIPVLKKIADLDLRQNRFPFALNIYKRVSALTNRHYGSRSKKAKQVTSKIVEIRRTAREWKRLGSKAAAMTQSRKPPSQPAVKIKSPNLRKSSVVAAKGRVSSSSKTIGRSSLINNKVKQKSVVANKPVGAHKKNIVKTTVVTKKPIIPYKDKATPAKLANKIVKKTKPVNKSLATATTKKSPTVTITPSAPLNLDAEGIPRDPGEKYKVGYFISMGCFGDKPFAVRQINRLMKLSVPVYMKSIRSNTLHCVFGGPFATRSEAEAGEEISRTKARVKDTLVRSYK